MLLINYKKNMNMKGTLIKKMDKDKNLLQEISKKDLVFMEIKVGEIIITTVVVTTIITIKETIIIIWETIKINLEEINNNKYGGNNKLEIMEIIAVSERTTYK